MSNNMFRENSFHIYIYSPTENVLYLAYIMVKYRIVIRRGFILLEKRYVIKKYTTIDKKHTCTVKSIK